MQPSQIKQRRPQPAPEQAEKRSTENQSSAGNVNRDGDTDAMPATAEHSQNRHDVKHFIFVIGEARNSFPLPPPTRYERTSNAGYSNDGNNWHQYQKSFVNGIGIWKASAGFSAFDLMASKIMHDAFLQCTCHRTHVTQKIISQSMTILTVKSNIIYPSSRSVLQAEFNLKMNSPLTTWCLTIHLLRESGIEKGKGGDRKEEKERETTEKEEGKESTRISICLSQDAVITIFFWKICYQEARVSTQKNMMHTKAHLNHGIGSGLRNTGIIITNRVRILANKAISSFLSICSMESND